MDNNIVTIISLIEKRPGMYIGTKTITELQGFITGYFITKHLNDEYDESERNLLRHFAEWIKTHHLPYLRDTDFSWYSLLRLRYLNESLAFESFFELWNEFLDDTDYHIRTTVSCPQYGQ